VENTRFVIKGGKRYVGARHGNIAENDEIRYRRHAHQKQRSAVDNVFPAHASVAARSGNRYCLVLDFQNIVPP
jgi:hypothetical protein